MRVISKRRLKEFWEEYANAKAPLTHWYNTTSDDELDWQNHNDVRQTFAAADLVGNCTVFNIGGNNFRLITRILGYKVYVLAVLTHDEYDNGQWKNSCGCYQD